MKTSKLLKEMDRLWDYHYWQTRELIKDYVYNTKCFDADLEALMENQDNLGNNFSKLTHNKQAGVKLTKLLKEHINLAIQIVVAANSKMDITQLNKLWQQNASQIAHLYHNTWDRINEKKMNRHMQEHLTTTLDEASAIINKDCVQSYEKGEIALEHIHKMSDYIADKF